jgi:hypothetical protein
MHNTCSVHLILRDLFTLTVCISVKHHTLFHCKTKAMNIIEHYLQLIVSFAVYRQWTIVTHNMFTSNKKFLQGRGKSWSFRAGTQIPNPKNEERICHLRSWRHTNWLWCREMLTRITVVSILNSVTNLFLVKLMNISYPGSMGNWYAWWWGEFLLCVWGWERVQLGAYATWAFTDINYFIISVLWPHTWAWRIIDYTDRFVI